MTEMASPIAAADRTGNQPVGGLGVRNAEQPLGETEQEYPLLARQPVFVEEGIDAPRLAPPSPRGLDEPTREQLDPALLALAHARLLDQRLDQRPSSASSALPIAARSGCRLGIKLVRPLILF